MNTVRGPRHTKDAGDARGLIGFPTAVGSLLRGETLGDLVGAIPFDDAVADRLAQAAKTAADVMRAQAGARRGAAEDAAQDFKGAYAGRFIESVGVEAGDRLKLASVLDGLSEAVTAAKADAEKERTRLHDLEAWQKRQDERRAAEAAAPLGPISLPPARPFDIKPSEIPVRPVPIEASFAPRGRVRTGLGTGHGRSSAVPSTLRSFATMTRAKDTALATQAVSVKNAWSAFTGACTWVPVTSATFAGGFERLLEENEADAAWVERIAQAFERAGGDGLLSNVSLDAADANDLPARFRNLFREGATPAEVAAFWARLGYTKADERDLAALPTSALSKLGNLEGVPYWARNTANVAVLDQRIADARNFLNGLNQPSNQDQPARAANARDLRALENIKTSLVQGRRAGERSLISLTGDHPPLAAVSIGDLDTAKNVTLAVPGMASSSEKMTGWADASQRIFDEQGRVHGEPERAVVAWMGYDSPPIPGAGNVDPGVWQSDYAKAGGKNLANTLRGLEAVRAGSAPTTNVVAHSYGTTTAAFALTEEGVHVDSLVTLASAGLPDSVPNASTLHADEVYAGQAEYVNPITDGTIPRLREGKGDQWASVGREFSDDHHVDPSTPGFGAHTFGADGDGPLVGVTDHGVHTSHDTGYLDRDTQSLRNVAYATTNQEGKLTK